MLIRLLRSRLLQYLNIGTKRTVLLHDTEKFNDDLRARSDQDLAFSGFLGIVDAFQAIVED